MIEALFNAWTHAQASAIGWAILYFEEAVKNQNGRASESLGNELDKRLALGKELDECLGTEKFKGLGQDLAMVIAQYGLTRDPEICEKVFRYMAFVISGWNSM